MRRIAIVLVSLVAACTARDPSGMGSVKAPATHDYTIAVLVAGARASEMDEAAVSEASIGHRAHIDKMGADGTLLLAAPFGEPRANESWRGIYVFDRSNVDQAYEAARTDPSIVAGLFEMKLLPWRSDVDLRPLRAELEQRKAAGAPFVPAAYVLAIGEPAEHVPDALRHLDGKGRIICAGEFGGEREGEVLLLLTAETVEEASAWLDSGTSLVRWEVSSLWATELLGGLADGR